jgi:lipopolysaccharide transport system ATP-binding protein
MGNLALRIEGLGKKYRIGRKRQKYKTLRETIMDTMTAPFQCAAQLWRGERARGAQRDEIIWALREVSLEIEHGEVVGIIGRNGAGKSTLLKILSRVTEPTTGYADIYGRVGSLLEVGTGFHNELTGRENIYLNGAILGMKRAEIDRKFDEIVAFAEVEQFIDTPVKHYSSGMYLRLAFAVAAHLEPEILIVDEVLAVGDMNFQRKCLDKMQDVGQQGRTVLLVSHNMSAITRMCARAILLHQGQIIKDGPSHQVVNAYLSSGLATTAVREWPDPATAPGGRVARLRAVRVRTHNGQITDTADIRQPVKVEMEFEVLQSGHILLPYFQFHTGEGITVFESNDLDPAWRGRTRPPGRWISTALIPGNLLSEGVLTVSPGLVTLEPVSKQFYERGVVAFQVIDNLNGDSARGDWNGPFTGFVRPLLQWDTQFAPDVAQSGNSRLMNFDKRVR